MLTTQVLVITYKLSTWLNQKLVETKDPIATFLVASYAKIRRLKRKNSFFLLNPTKHKFVKESHFQEISWQSSQTLFLLLFLLLFLFLFFKKRGDKFESYHANFSIFKTNWRKKKYKVRTIEVISLTWFLHNKI